jgi:hypothetical protein
MYVIFLVARDTFYFCVFVGIRRVALFTGHKHVHATQREFGNVVIEHHLGFPAALVMTTFADFTFLAAVRIVETMTGDTRGADLFFKQQTTMAVFAGDFFVPATQMEIGVFVMFEFGATPTLDGMTFLAIFTVLPFVFVTGLVTRNTFGL